MQLLLIRHAIAEEREEFASTGQPDSERPLTKEGRRQMRRNARGLRRIAPTINLFLTSPFLRATQTTKIVAQLLDIADTHHNDLLTPARHPREFIDWLAQQEPNAIVAAVGHEPHLGLLATCLLSGGDESRVQMKKGGACLLNLGQVPRAGGAKLLWLLKPSQLRRIAG